MKPDEMTTDTVWEKLEPLIKGLIKTMDGEHSDINKLSTIWHGIGDDVIPLFKTGEFDKVDAVAREAYCKKFEATNNE